MSVFQSIMNGIFGHRGQDEPHAAPSGTTGGPGRDNAPLSAAPDSAPDVPGHSPMQRASVAGGPDPSPLSAAPDSAPDAHHRHDAVDVVAVLSRMEAASGQTLDWRHSIVDLMKLLGIDSSLPARRELARELGYAASTDDTAALNLWLHRQVMQKLAAQGGKVPAERTS